MTGTEVILTAVAVILLSLIVVVVLDVRRDSREIRRLSRHAESRWAKARWGARK